MRRILRDIRNTLIAGLFFLLPLFVLLVILLKVFQIFHRITTRLAEMIGVENVMGMSGSTIVGIISLTLVCLLCGYLMRISVLKQVSSWVNEQLKSFIPGYAMYHKLVTSTLDKNEENREYETAVFVKSDDGMRPGFLMETMPNGNVVIFYPSAGNVREGELYVVDAANVEMCPDVERRLFRLSLANLGVGLSKLCAKQFSDNEITR
jgi:uncharacterized membrane protein